MQLLIEGVMDVGRGVEIRLHLILANGTPEEFAPACLVAAPTLKREPLAPSATAGAILRRAVRIDLYCDGPLRVRFLSCQAVNLATELIGLLPVQSPGLAASFPLYLPQPLEKEHASGILSADLGNGAGGFVRHIAVLPPNMVPKLLIALLPFDRLAGLPLLLPYPSEMLIAMLIQSPIPTKAVLP